MKPTWITETLSLIGQSVELSGWVDNVRDHGKVFFLDLRDRSGIIQCVITQAHQNFETAKTIRPESVIRLRGTIQARPEKLINPNLATGTIELAIEEITILALAETPPIPLNTDGYEINEETRLHYRYLDLRRQRLQQNLIQRAKVTHFIRSWLSQRNFIEIETPILTKSTPGGARDYLVPSRQQPGNFYALPQSPQQYKQLLMVAGMEYYFQITRCFRDEDPRGDRQPEFTQLDLELSFVDQEDILALTEDIFLTLVRTLYPQKKLTLTADGRIPRMTYREAMEKYQSDKPDVRQNRDDPDELAFLFVVDFPAFEWKEADPSASSGQGKGRWDAVHHPFTAPQVKDVDDFWQKFKSAPAEMLAQQYDFVCNGYEIGGGSIRIHDPKLLAAVFQAMGHSAEAVQEKFGHLLEAFTYGVPPHGGIAPGLDRLMMVLQNEPNIREVIAFPKTSEGRDPMMGAPSEVDPQQLRDLGLKIEKNDE